MRCPMCGTENPDSSKFCSVCRTKLSENDESTNNQDSILQREQQSTSKIFLVAFGVLVVMFVLLIVMLPVFSKSDTPNYKSVIATEKQGFSKGTRNKNKISDISLEQFETDALVETLLEETTPIVEEKNVPAPETLSEAEIPSNTGVSYKYVINSESNIFHFKSCHTINNADDSIYTNSNESPEVLTLYGYIPCTVCDPYKDITDSETKKESTYILNTSTKKIHHPKCSSVKDMKNANKKSTSSDLSSLLKEGYSKCKKCLG